MASRSRVSRGFASAEVLVALGILAAALVPAASWLYVSRVTQVRAEQRAGAQQSARSALDAMLQQLRLAGSDLARVIPFQLNPVAFQEATPTALTFIGDVEGPGRPMKVRYRYDAAGKRILREVWRTWTGAAWGPSTGEVRVGEHVSGVTFAYFTGADQAATLPAGVGQIRRVVIEIRAADLSPAGPSAYRLSSDVRVRGLN